MLFLGAHGAHFENIPLTTVFPHHNRLCINKKEPKKEEFGDI
jgi:hypothetical protein